MRNLKIRVHEHALPSSKSAISLHVRDSLAAIEEIKKVNPEFEPEDNHEVLPESTIVISQERNTRKRKFIESICILSKAPRVCNLGPSAEVSHMWNPNLTCVARALPALD